MPNYFDLCIVSKMSIDNGCIWIVGKVFSGAKLSSCGCELFPPDHTMYVAL